MRISDWSSDVCSSDLFAPVLHPALAGPGLSVKHHNPALRRRRWLAGYAPGLAASRRRYPAPRAPHRPALAQNATVAAAAQGRSVWQSTRPDWRTAYLAADRSEEHTSELQSLMRI